MSGTRSASKKAPATEGRWPVWKLTLLLSPAVIPAVWINLFMASLMTSWLGLPAFSPVQALLWALPLSVPASIAAGRWLRRMLDRAEGY